MKPFLLLQSNFLPYLFSFPNLFTFELGLLLNDLATTPF